MQADADTATIGVQDFGIGIAQEKHAHVFDRFFRVSDPEHETFPGLGLGLYISAEIVKRQGGRMWVESRQGVGSTFSFTVPFAPPPSSSTVQEEGGRATCLKEYSLPMTISGIGDMMQLMLEEAGYDVEIQERWARCAADAGAVP